MRYDKGVNLILSAKCLQLGTEAIHYTPPLCILWDWQASIKHTNQLVTICTQKLAPTCLRREISCKKQNQKNILKFPFRKINTFLRTKLLIVSCPLVCSLFELSELHNRNLLRLMFKKAVCRWYYLTVHKDYVGEFADNIYRWT
jgi:hypothetical protein